MKWLGNHWNLFGREFPSEDEEQAKYTVVMHVHSIHFSDHLCHNATSYMVQNIKKQNKIKVLYLIYLQPFSHEQTVESKTLFIVATDAHYYKIIEILKQFTNLKL